MGMYNDKERLLHGSTNNILNIPKQCDCVADRVVEAIIGRQAFALFAMAPPVGQQIRLPGRVCSGDGRLTLAFVAHGTTGEPAGFGFVLSRGFAPGFAFRGFL